MFRKTLMALAAAAAVPALAQTAPTSAPAEEDKATLPMTKDVVTERSSGRRSQDANEAVRDVAGVTPSAAAGTPFDQILIRGVRVNPFSNYRLDGGVPISGVVTPPSENKTGVEALKGANALMFGVASPAGILNLLPKRAGANDVTSVGLQANSFGQIGAQFDIGRRLGDARQVGVRLNASMQHLENGIRDTGGRGSFIGLGVDARATERLTLQADLEYYERETLEQPVIAVLPAVAGVIAVPRVPDPRNFLGGSWALFKARVTNAQVRADYVISKDWKLLVQMGESDAHRVRNPARIINYNPVTGANGSVVVPTLTIDANNKFARMEAIGRFNTGSVAHALTLGVAETHRDTLTYDQNNVVLPVRQNIFDPVALPSPVYTRAYTSLPSQSSRDQAVYGYDTISLMPQLKVLVGLRQTKQTEIVGSAAQVSHHNSPGLGVLWDLRPKTTVYASYLKGLEAGGVAPPSAANANVVLPPGESKQKEVGLRDGSIQGLNFNISYFEVERANNITHPTTNVFDYFGTVKFKGLELGGGYAINRAWRLNGGLLTLDAAQNAAGQSFNGKVPDNVPKISGTLRVTHDAAQWQPGLSLTAGGRFIARRPVDPLDQGYIPGFAVFDAGATYATRWFGRSVILQGSVDNLANRRYWNAVFAQQILPGMDRKLNLSAKLDF